MNNQNYLRENIFQPRWHFQIFAVYIQMPKDEEKYWNASCVWLFLSVVVYRTNIKE